MNRPSDKAGSWYSGEAIALRSEVTDCLQKANELYADVLQSVSGKPASVVVPHAGLFFSGSLAALSFELVRRRWESVDTFVIFGACHRERLREPGVWGDGEWETPLGPVRVDMELASDLVAGGVGRVNERAHFGDNSIELQMPFIKVMFPDTRIVPVAMGFFPDAWKYGQRAAEIVKSRGQGNVVAVASTDLTHYGASFGVMPAGVGESALAWTRENDGRFLDAAVKMDYKNIVSIAERDGSACGAGAVAAAMGWAHEFGCTGGKILARTDSYEVMPRGAAEHIVGYGALSFSMDEGTA